jgi:hypothetical protein
VSNESTPPSELDDRHSLIFFGGMFALALALLLAVIGAA